MTARTPLAALALLLAGGCALGDGRGNEDAGPGGADGAVADAGAGDAGRADAQIMSDAGPPTGADAGPGDAGSPPRDGGADAGPPTGTPLDPRLSLPDPSGQRCVTPGSMGECAGITVCRFYDSTEGRCESCGPCGNLNALCSSSAECDILFMCFAGRCTNFCTLGTFECGPVEDCIDVGHPSRGVCRP